MFTVVAMAVFAHDALGEGSVGFALSYAALQFILIYLWWRTGVHDSDHRPLSQPYSLAFLLTTLQFVVSVFVTIPWRFYVCGLALFISLLLPLRTFSLGKNNPQIQTEIERSAISHSAVERFGLFNIIVLGEVVVGVVQGVASHHDLSLNVGVTAALGLLVPIGLWWVYFDFVSHRLPVTSRAATTFWLYLHLPMTISITATGAAVLNIVEHAGEHLPGEVIWLLVGALAIALINIALLTRTIQLSKALLRIHRIGRPVMIFASIGIVLLGFSGLDTIPLLAVVILLLLVPVLAGLWTWIVLLGAAEIEVT